MRSFGFLSAYLLFFVSCSSKPKADITIAAASNTQFYAEALIAEYTKDSDVNCELIIGSSGKLSHQIKQGADYDLFLSADRKYATSLHEMGFTDSEPRLYASGSLVIWTCKEGIEPSLPAMLNDKVQSVAIANTELAPYGKAAFSYIEKSGYRDEVIPKLVYGESLSQTNQYIFTQNAELGITSKSSVVRPGEEVDGKWLEIPNSKYFKINQALAVMKGIDQHRLDATYDFVDFMFSEKGQEILIAHGYSVPTE